MIESKLIGLMIAKGDADQKESVATVCFCESSVSLRVGDFTAHIPWTELATWQAWLAEKIQEGE